MVEDGGYPPSVEPLVGLFRSPLWARRNRYLEVEGVPSSFAPPGRTLRVQAFADAMSGIPTADLLEEQVRNLLPPWFVEALDTNRKELSDEPEQRSSHARPAARRTVGDACRSG